LRTLVLGSLAYLSQRQYSSIPSSKRRRGWGVWSTFDGLPTPTLGPTWRLAWILFTLLCCCSDAC